MGIKGITEIHLCFFIHLVNNRPYFKRGVLSVYFSAQPEAAKTFGTIKHFWCPKNALQLITTHVSKHEKSSIHNSNK